MHVFLSMFPGCQEKHDFERLIFFDAKVPAAILYIISTIATGTSELRLRDFFFGIPPLPSVSTLPLDPPLSQSDLLSNSFAYLRSSSFLGGASSENSNPTSGHLSGRAFATTTALAVRQQTLTLKYVGIGGGGREKKRKKRRRRRRRRKRKKRRRRKRRGRRRKKRKKRKKRRQCQG